MRIRTIGDITILQLCGRIEVQDGAEQLRSTIEELRRSGRHKILLNLDQVIAADTAGIDALLDSYDLVTSGGGCLRFAGPANGVRHLLSMTKLKMGIDVHPSVGSAVASFP